MEPLVLDITCPSCGAPVTYTVEVLSCPYCGHIWGFFPAMMPAYYMRQQ